MHDGIGREVNYLRISVTDRCNFRCRYCMPPQGVDLLECREILSYEEMLRVVSILGTHGVDKVRVTGGEPLIRKGIVEFVRCLRSISTVRDLSLTTNGSILSDMAYDLKAAGLDRVNISLDTVNPDRFSYITGRGNVNATLQGINSALEAGLNPVKLNVVLTEALTAEDVDYFVEQVHRYPIAVRFIEYMPVGPNVVKAGLSIAEIKRLINKAGRGSFEPAMRGKGNGPAKYVRLPKAVGIIGFITPISDHFCQECTRIRLTADGKIKPCLLANCEFDVKAALRGGQSDKEIYGLFVEALRKKPGRHCLGKEDDRLARSMIKVGG